jgi:hypothetical protein
LLSHHRNSRCEFRNPGAPEVVLTQAYDERGLRTSLAATIDGVDDFNNAYSYDDLGRLTQVTQVAPGEVEAIGDIGHGIAGYDPAVGAGYILYSEEDVHTRFAPNAPDVNTSDHLIAVRFIDGQWYYEDNYNQIAFTPVEGDLLVAAVDFTNDTIEMLEGQSGSYEGIELGYYAGDLVGAANWYYGTYNNGEFTVEGTWFSRNAASDKRVDFTYTADSRFDEIDRYADLAGTDLLPRPTIPTTTPGG